MANNSLLETNINISPYFDDFDSAKQYYKTLFKPSTAIQVRELNTVQSTLQNQISAFGQNIFKEGSVIKGCSFNFDNNYHYIKLNDVYANGSALNISDLEGYTVSNPNGLTAVVIDTLPGLYSNNPNLNTVYVKYLNSSTFSNGMVQSSFIQNDLLTFSSSANVVQGAVYSANVANVAGIGYAFTTTDGIIFKKGYFIEVTPQTVIIDRYDNNPDQISVGFEAQEQIVTASIDNSLFDNAIGSPNYSAPGADRLKLIPNLVVRPTNSSNSSSFFSLVDFVNGQPITIRNNAQFNSIEKEFAQRSYETNGNFVVNPFIVTSQALANTSDPNYANNFNAIVGSGLGYVNGFRVQYINNNTKMIRRGTDFTSVSQQQVSLNYGYYIQAEEVSGIFFNPTNVVQVQLHSIAKQSVTNKTFLSTGYSSTTQIGTAYVKSFAFEGGKQGSNTATFNVYLFNISMNSGTNFSSVKSIIYNNGSLAGIGDVIQSFNTTSNSYVTIIEDNSLNTLLFPFGQRSIKENGFNNTEFTYRKVANAQVLTNGTSSITVQTPIGSGSEKFIYLGALSGNEEANFIVVPTQTGFSTNKTGNVSISSVNTSVIGVSSSFTSDYFVGDYIYTDAFTARIVSIANNTYMTVDSPFSSNGTALTHQKVFIQGNQIPFVNIPSRSMSIGSNTLSIALGESISSPFNIEVCHDLVRSQTTSIKKNINNNVFVKINLANSAFGTTGPWCLGFPDAFSLTGVYIGSGNTYSNTGFNYVKSFDLDNGQRDMHYDLSFLNLTTNSLADNLNANSTILVQMSLFTFDTSQGVGFFNANSYPIDDINLANTNAITTPEIPTYTTSSGTFVDLRDCVDFRPFASATATVATSIASATVNPVYTLSFNYTPYVPSPDSIFQTDLEYYLGRQDRLAIDTNGNLVDTEGTPAFNNPSPPVEKNGTMTLSLLLIPPYPSLTTSEAKKYNRYDYAIQSTVSQNRRYTMKDIGKLDQRITNLEYYTSLSLLEQSVSSLTIKASTTGQNRFQNGIFVDPFRGFDLSNTLDSNFNIAIDSTRNELRPAFIQTSASVEFNANASTGVVKAGELILLDYNGNNVLVTQGFASQFRNCIDGDIYKWTGTITLTPSGSLQPDLTTSPSVINNICLAQNWINLQHAWGTEWGNWTTTVVENCEPVTTTSSSCQSVSGGTLNSTTTSVLQSTSTIQQQVGTQLNNAVSTQQYNLGNFVTNISILPYIPTATIQFAGTGLKPNTRLYAYFGGVPVSAWCSPAAGIALGTALFSDVNGNCNGFFTIPPNKFQSQEITFELNDISNLTQGSDAITTQADGVYYGSTLSVASGSSLLNTRTTVLSAVEVTNQQIISGSTSSSNTVVKFIPNPSVKYPPPVNGSCSGSCSSSGYCGVSILCKHCGCSYTGCCCGCG